VQKNENRLSSGVLPSGIPQCCPKRPTLGFVQRTPESLAQRCDPVSRERAPRLRPRGARPEREIGPGPYGLERNLPDLGIVHGHNLSMVRVVSLVPAATEMVWALGATDQLVAVTHDDDFPPAVLALPRVTRSTIPTGATAREIDTDVREAGARGESTFHLDERALRDAQPDVILGQTLCAVCAVTLDLIPASLEHEPLVVPLDASSIDGMLEDIRRVAVALGREDEAERVVAGLRARLTWVAERVGGRPRPRVACLEWLDPLFNAGHWVPEQVRIAGGEDVLGAAGARSREITWDDVLAARPEIVIAMPCGWDAERAAREAEALGDFAGARAFGVDGAAYFSRPGPRLVDGAELLASILHPGLVAPPDGGIAIGVRSAV
jgi:iron complex transport system substrate-binding protein